MITLNRLLIVLCSVILFVVPMSAETFILSEKTKIVSDVISAKEILKSYLDKSVAVTTSKQTPENFIVITYVDSNVAQTYISKKQRSLLKDDGFILSINAQNIVISAKNERGLVYGVFHLLENYLGFVFLTQDVEITPSRQFFKIPADTILENPHFGYREYFSAESDDLEFATKMRLNGRFGHRNNLDKKYTNMPIGRTIFNQFTTAELIKDEKYKCNGQYDVSSINAAKRSMLTLQEKSAILYSPDAMMLIEHEDRESYCSKGVPKGGNPSIPFLNYNAYLADQLPDVEFLYQAYQWSRTPPKKSAPLPDNLTIFYSPIEADFSKPLNDDVNKFLIRDLKAWQRYQNDIFVWQYVTNFGGYMQPYPNLIALDQDIKELASMKEVKGIFLQGAYETKGSELADLRTWVFAKLLWNPKQDIYALIKTFCDHYYGAASTKVMQYIKQLQQIIEVSDSRLSLKTSANAKYLNSKNLKSLDAMLDEALLTVSKESVYYERVLDLFSGIDYVRVVRGDSDFQEKSKQRLNRYLNINEEITAFAEGRNITNIKNLISLERRIPNTPKYAKGLKQGSQWYDFQAYTLKLCCADLVEDKNASDNVSAMMSGREEAWGFQLDLVNFPKGTWDIYARVKIKLSASNSMFDQGKIAIYYGIHPTFIKGAHLISQFEVDTYKDIKIGTINTASNDGEYIWISPSGNEYVDSIYVDRIYIVQNNSNIL